MKSLVQCDGHERCGPYGIGGIDKESSNDTCHTVSNEVGTQGDEDLVSETGCITLIIWESALCWS
jgi:hypothetical protein